jgi:glycine dehydrogenase
MSAQFTTDLPEFAGRHIGPSSADIDAMLAVVRHDSLDDLVDHALPGAIRTDGPLRVDPAESESAVVEELRAVARRNQVMTSMIGLGYYGTITPAVIQRNVLENPAWYTAYTPYQPEISQGRLEALLNFQTVVSDLTGLTTSGASLLDEGTAAAEAMTLMRRSSKTAADAVLVVDQHVFPQTLAVMQTRAKPLGLEVVVADLDAVDSADALRVVAGDRAVFGVLVQYPGADGELRDWRALAAAAHDAGALVTAAADLLALTLATAPGEWGADVAVGTTQRFGVPMGFGGPHAGYLSVRAGLERSLPGRLVGVSVDAEGAPAYRLALQTREQHIRREKATSNICTSQQLNALAATIYMSWLGRQGIVELGRLMAQRTAYARERLAAVDGVELLHEQPVVREFAVRLDAPVGAVLRRLGAEGINGGYPLAHDYAEFGDGLLVAITERRTRAHIDLLADALERAIPAERTATEAVRA